MVYEAHSGPPTLQTGHVDAVAAALLDLKRGTSISSSQPPQQLTTTSSASVTSLQSHDVSRRPSSQTNDRICKDVVVDDEVIVMETAKTTTSAQLPLQMPPSTLSVSAPQPLNNGVIKQPATVLAEASPELFAEYVETNSSRQQLIMASLQEYQRRAQLPINYFDSNKIVELGSGGAMHHHSSYPHPPSQSVAAGLLPPQPSLLPTQSYGDQSFDRCISNSFTMVSDASATTGTAAGSQSFDTLMSHGSNNNLDYYNHNDDVGGNNENSNMVMGPLSQMYGERVESRRNNGGGGGGSLSEIYEESRSSKQKVMSSTLSTNTKNYGNANPAINNTKHRTAPGRLPNHVRDYLKHWVDNHIDYPYPSEKEKEVMMSDTGIDRKKLDIWFRNNRNRYVKVKRSAKQLQQMQRHMHKMKHWNHDPQLILKP
jgi:hypothetical protein